MSTGALVERYRTARKDPALAVLEGFHALKHALRFDAVVLDAVAADPEALAVLARDLAPDVAARMASTVRLVPPDLLAQLVPVVPGTGVVALARRPVIDPVAVIAGEGSGPIVLLDRPAHAGNVGAVIRVAAAADAVGVLTLGGQDPWQPVALRGSAGLHFALPVARIEALPATWRPILALDPAGAPLAAGSLPRGAILAFGSERGGLDPDLLARAGQRLAIPMRAGVSSLNLATAVAVTLYMAR